MMEHSEDYIGEDGLLYCGKCKTRKQYNPSFNGRVMIVGVPCKCEQERRQKEEEERKREEEIVRIRRMKATCIHDKGLLNCTFVNDDGSVKQIKIARWGTAQDIKPYMDDKPENNIILTETEGLTMSSRPKQPKYARNKNVVVIGGSGSAKTRFFVKPNLMQMHSSYVVTDPKG